MINDLLQHARTEKCSDLHITFGEPPIVRKNGSMKRLESFGILDESKIDGIVTDMLKANGIKINPNESDIDFCYVTPEGNRQRVNIFRQKGHKAAVLRLLNTEVPTMEQIKLPEVFTSIACIPRGMVLVTGPTGSGKTTTLAAIIDYINKNRSDHILTLEDPIEYVHPPQKSIVNQREIGEDVDSFSGALRSALREDPDVILVGEMRDLETIGAAITAAETGHMVMSTLHTIGAAKTIDRVIDVFPPHQQQQVRVQLATVLKAVITQTLIPTADGAGRVAAFEIMIVNDAISNLIREGKTYQINSVLQTSTKVGMVSLDMYLGTLVKQGIIEMEKALDKCVSHEELKRYAGVS